MFIRLRTKLALIIILVCWLSTAHLVRAQRPDESETVVVEANNNEDSKAALALLAQTLNPHEFVIIIARAGTGDSLRGLSLRRLAAVQSYVNVTRSTPIPKEKIVTAQSQPVRGRGRIEVYLRGRLFMVFVFDRNKNFAPEA